MKAEANPGVKPVKSVKDLRKWEKHIEENGSLKLLAYFVLGLDTGLAPYFLCNLKWEDIQHEKQTTLIEVIDYYLLVPSKIQEEPRKIYLSSKSVNILRKLREKKPDDIFVFQSEAPNCRKKIKPIHENAMRHMLRESAKDAGIAKGEAIGPITLRKSFGYHHLVHGTWSLHELMRYFEQRSLKATKNYVGITNERINEERLPRRPRTK